MKEEKIFNECLERMEILKLSKNCIDAFKKNEIWESEGYGALYELNDEEKEIVKKFETEHKGYKVYHLYHGLYEFGECYSILFVGTDTREWKRDKTELKEGYAFSYVYNKTDEWCSEFGSIIVKPSIGGIVRVG